MGDPCGSSPSSPRDLRTCPGPINVVTNDDGIGLAEDIRKEKASGQAPTLQNALRGGINVTVTGLWSPGQWPPDAAADPATTALALALAGQCSRCLSTVFPGEANDDGAVIGGHDSMLTVVRAIRSTVSKSQQDQTVTREDVLQSLLGFGVSRPVAGAGGPIGFDDQGRPIGRPVPVLGIDAQGTITYQGQR